MHFSTIVSTVAFAAPALAGYVLQDDYMTDFYGHFNFYNQADPTHGFVQYVDEATARSGGLIDASGPPVPVKWGVDTTNSDPNGRASIRLESKTVYNKGLVVIDVAHMPFGCGTWPAFWMFGPNWPYQGEIDIIEGVHEQANNALTLHTSTGCAVGSDTSLFTGTVQTQNCDVKGAGQPDNAGCSIQSQDSKSYGDGLNNNGGGVYATEWTSDAISIWFFPRDSVPDGVTGDSPDPSTWGTPAAKWVKDSCDIDGIFKDLSIIFDTTFCGDWAGNTWSSSSCASKAATCNEFVQNNPDAFKNAFWTVNALKVYQQGDAAAPAPAAPAPATTDVPVDQPVATDAPAPVSTDAPAPDTTDAPVETQPTATDAPVESVPDAPLTTGVVGESPPIVATSENAIATGAPVQENPDGTVSIPLGPWGTNGEGGGNAAEDAPGAATAPSAAVPSAVATVSTPAANSGGFVWPGAAQGTGSPSVAPPVPSFDSGNTTGYPVLPSGTGSGDIAEVWETIYTTQIVTVPGQGPAPTNQTDNEPPIATVQQTIFQTVMVTVNAGAQGQATPAPAPARMARRERAIRRRVANNDRL